MCWLSLMVHTASCQLGEEPSCSSIGPNAGFTDFLLQFSLGLWLLFGVRGECPSLHYSAVNQWQASCKRGPITIPLLKFYCNEPWTDFGRLWTSCPFIRTVTKSMTIQYCENTEDLGSYWNTVVAVPNSDELTKRQKIHHMERVVLRHSRQPL